MRKFVLILLLGLSVFVSIVKVNAQPNYPAPTGVWCSCPPTTGVGNGSVDPAVASKSYVKGILVRVSWKDIETADNIYNWSLIDSQIVAAQSFGKKISLGVGGGPNSPGWLYSAGAQSISYTVPFSGTIPVPWDSTFLSKWTEFVTALGNRYANDTTIQLVYITNSSTNGFEMQLPFNPTPSFQAIGYTDQKVIDSWNVVADTFKNAFPNHYLSNDYHPVNNSNAVADVVYAYTTAQIGSRYGAAGWWWTQNNIFVYRSQYSILRDSAMGRQFAGLQMAYSGIQNPNQLGTGGLATALYLAIASRVCYWEVWNNDITAGTFDTLLSNASCSQAGNKPVRVVAPEPNASSTAGAQVTLSAIVKTAVPKIVRVDFRANGQLIGSATNGNLNVVWTPPVAGNYNITAEALRSDNTIATISTPTQLTVVAAARLRPFAPFSQ